MSKDQMLRLAESMAKKGLDLALLRRAEDRDKYEQAFMLYAQLLQAGLGLVVCFQARYTLLCCSSELRWLQDQKKYVELQQAATGPCAALIHSDSRRMSLQATASVRPGRCAMAGLRCGPVQPHIPARCCRQKLATMRLLRRKR